MGSMAVPSEEGLGGRPPNFGSSSFVLRPNLIKKCLEKDYILTKYAL